MLWSLSSGIKQGHVIGSVWKWIKNLLTSSKDFDSLNHGSGPQHLNLFCNFPFLLFFFSSLPSSIFLSLRQGPRFFALQRPKAYTYWEPRHPQKSTRNFSHNFSPILSHLPGKTKEKGWGGVRKGETESWSQLTKPPEEIFFFKTLSLKPDDSTIHQATLRDVSG